MGIVRRQSIKTTIIFGAGIALGYLNIIILLPYCLSPDEIGLLRVLQGAATIFSIFIPFGFEKVIVRYFPQFEDKEKKHHGFFIFIMLFPLLCYLIFTLLFFIFQDVIIDIYKDKSPLFTEFVLFLLPLTFFMMYINLLSAYMQSHLRTVPGIFVKQILIRGGIIISVLIYFFEFVDLYGFITCVTLTY
ncbi:MAG: lipopolysaccharide biosynthesis protein, partial [Flavobacteriales bacterium]